MPQVREGLGASRKSSHPEAYTTRWRSPHVGQTMTVVRSCATVTRTGSPARSCSGCTNTCRSGFQFARIDVPGASARRQHGHKPRTRTDFQHAHLGGHELVQGMLVYGITLPIVDHWKMPAWDTMSMAGAEI